LSPQSRFHPVRSSIQDRFSGSHRLLGIGRSVYFSILRSVPLRDHSDGFGRPLPEPLERPVKDKIHPEYHPECKVYFRGDVVMTVGATVPEMHVEVWSGSHPFYTGKSAFVDTAGRVEKFQRKFAGNYFDKKKKD
jgi:large subunit ribosomal protein L31